MSEDWLLAGANQSNAQFELGRIDEDSPNVDKLLRFGEIDH